MRGMATARVEITTEAMLEVDTWCVTPRLHCPKEPVLSAGKGAHGGNATVRDPFTRSYIG